MIGVIVVAHGMLADAFYQTMEMIIGHQENIETFSINHIDNFDKAKENLRLAINRVNTGYGVIILTDMLGGTPSNLSLSFLKEEQVEVITGINLPMLIKLSDLRKKFKLDALKKELCAYGREKIIVASDLLNKKNCHN